MWNRMQDCEQSDEFNELRIAFFDKLLCFYVFASRHRVCAQRRDYCRNNYHNKH